MTLHRTLGDRASIAFSMLGLADLARHQGDSAGVREHCEPSLTILRELGMQWAIGFALHTLAFGAYYASDLTLAFTLVDESVSLFRNLQSDASLAEVLITLGKIVRAQGDMEGLACVVAEQGQAELIVRLLAPAAALRAQMAPRCGRLIGARQIRHRRLPARPWASMPLRPSGLRPRRCHSANSPTSQIHD